MILNQDFIKEKFNQWLTEFVEVPNPALGMWAPCPYARQARIDNKIELLFCENIADLLTDIHKAVTLIESSKEVAVVCFDPSMISVSELTVLVKDTNKSIMPNYVILEDHPDAKEYINGVKMNFGYCGLLVIQQLNKLNRVADQLQAKGYYNTWSTENIDEVVTWRCQ